MKIAILTSAGSWFLPHAQAFAQELQSQGHEAQLYKHHSEITEPSFTLFILSYFELIPTAQLQMHQHALVVHESALPKGRGWAPYFWQVIEGKNEIPIVLFQASEGADTGPIYLEDSIQLDGTELHDELRLKQVQATRRLCLNFLENHESITPREQEGQPSTYPRRGPKDSELDPNKSLAEQFNLLRTVNNQDFPAFFMHKGQKYLLTIQKDAD